MLTMTTTLFWLVWLQLARYFSLFSFRVQKYVFYRQPIYYESYNSHITIWCSNGGYSGIRYIRFQSICESGDQSQSLKKYSFNTIFFVKFYQITKQETPLIRNTWEKQVFLMGAPIRNSSKIGNTMYLFWKIFEKKCIFFTIFSIFFKIFSVFQNKKA